MRLLLLICLCFALPSRTWGGNSLLIATYNVENLFDTINDPGIDDTVLTPGEYREKLSNLARVIADLAPDVLGLSEIENAGVLRDLLDTPPLAGLPYDYVHYDSPDRRGIDVALFYRTDKLQIVNSEPIRAPGNYPTRDVLRAEALVTSSGRTLVFYTVHLPSRRGGYARATRTRELIAADLNERVQQESPEAGVVIMGDFNDNPTSKLIRRRLPALHVTTTAPYRKGQGSYAWRDAWQMYDNILVSRNLTLAGDARVFVKPYLLTPEGRFRGYPYRYVFSDHLPVYIRIVW